MYGKPFSLVFKHSQVSFSKILYGITASYANFKTNEKLCKSESVYS